MVRAISFLSKILMSESEVLWVQVYVTLNMFFQGYKPADFTIAPTSAPKKNLTMFLDLLLIKSTQTGKIEDYQ